MTGQTRQRSAYAHADTQGRTPLGVVLCACACALALCLGYLPQAALAWSDTTADFLVGQDYRSEVSGVDETFDYYMVADEAGAPMPAGARGRTYHWTMKRTETRTIVVQVPATARAEVYTYRFYQKVRSKKAGFTYDSTVFVGHLYTNSGAPVMLFSKKLGEAKVDDPRWSVSYREKAAPDYNSHKDGNSYPVIDTGDLLVLAPFAVLGAAALVVVVVRRRRRQEDARGGDAA